MFARRDGHHTRQPETIQEFPGDSRPSLHKMSSLSIALYLWGDLPPPLPLTPNWFLITDFSSSRRGGRLQGVGWGRPWKETEGLGAGGDGAGRWGPERWVGGEWRKPDPAGPSERTGILVARAAQSRRRGARFRCLCNRVAHEQPK